jgi:3-hydroxyisobutyrate dehydrogenase-like beta-hydroxyacid dehydrogenase
VVNLTSGTPDDARLLEERITAQGAGYVDGAIMAVPEMIGQPEAQILYSGSRPAFDAHRTTLQVLSPTSPFLGEDAGAAALYDTALLALLYATMSGWLHAYALAAAGGVDATALQPYAQAWFTHVVAADDSRAVAEQVDRGQYPDTVGSNLSLNAFGLGLVARAFREAGVSADLFAGLTRLAEQRVAEGHGDDGFTSLVESIKRPAADRATGA